MAADTTLYLQLHKLSAAATEKAIAAVLSTLWSTRRTGVGSLEKSRIKFLLNLPPTTDPGLVLACLRSVIRRCVHDDCGEEDIRKLFPADLPPELQTSLVLALLRHKNQWKEELSDEQAILPNLKSMTARMEDSKTSASKFGISSELIQQYVSTL